MADFVWKNTEARRDGAIMQLAEESGLRGDWRIPDAVLNISARRKREATAPDSARVAGHSLLESPEQRVPQLGGKEILQSRFTSGNGKMYLLRTVVAMHKEPPVVVTVYRRSKIEKYWRPE